MIHGPSRSEMVAAAALVPHLVAALEQQEGQQDSAH
jgi:hypothetical protein